MFYGWWIVTACVVFATVCWSLGTFGMSVYVFALTELRGFPITVASSAVTLAYLVSALVMVPVGRLVSRRGPRTAVAAGAVLMAIAVAAMPHCRQAWQLYPAFLLLGLGMGCMSTNTIGTTLAPWFERHQGRAMSTAMLGASAGGIIGPPLLIAGIGTLGFAWTGAGAALVALAVIVPIALFVLKAHPREIGQWPDGASEPTPATGASIAATRTVSTARTATQVDTAVPTGAAPIADALPWRLGDAMRTHRFQTQVLAFGIGLMVQIGFMSHHVKIAVPVLGASGAVTVVSAAAIAAFVGRLLLARFADRLDPRHIGGGVLLLAAAALIGIALLPGPASLTALSIVFGSTIGNVTTLAPLVIRREFGAASFGTVFGLAATLNQLMMSLGPSLYGGLRDWLGSYAPALVLCALLDVLAAAILLWGGRQPLRRRIATQA